jgi:hydroxymethylpyrimidine pyrophosphatase-like HAD family hydrolase
MEEEAKVESKHFPNTAWFFDVDGVLTNPEAKRVIQPEIFNELVKRLEIGEPVGLNSGRSLDFIITEILDPLETKLKDRCLFKNIFTVGELGAVWVSYDDDGVRSISQNVGLNLPNDIQNQIREILNQPPFSNIMFYDESKRTMVTVELKSNKTIAEFTVPQKNLVSTLQALLKKYHLEKYFRVSPTRIAIDVEYVNVGKALGARKLVELITKKGIEPQIYICFGDTTTDYEMFEELIRLGKKSRFVFVGGKENLIGRNLTPVTFTKLLVDKGTLEYLRENKF